jgi:hypothetical protein
MRTALLALAFLVSLPFGAHARVLGGNNVRVAIDGHREPGIGVHGGAHGWRLPIGHTAATSITLVDLTSPTRDKWVVPVQGQAIVLEAGRFIGGHAYRVELMNGITLVERAIVYLYPTRSGRSAHVELAFDDQDGDEVGADSGLRIMPKSAL